MHKIIKKIIALVLLSWSFTVCQMTSRVPNNVYGTVSLVIAQPQGEFSNNVSRNGLGVNLDGGWYIFNGPVSTTFFPQKSRTDLFCISVGIGF